MKYKKALIFIPIALFLFILSIITVNINIINNTKNKIIDISELNDKEDYHIIVLGASVTKKGVSKMLEDRLSKTIEVYNKTNNDILVSGDSRTEEYDETTKMYNYLIENGIPKDKITIDKKGLSTYDSIKRSKDKYNYDKIIIITQKYHLYRAIYISNKLDIDSYGIDANNITYKGQFIRDIREYLARYKDYFKLKLIKQPIQ